MWRKAISALIALTCLLTLFLAFKAPIKGDVAEGEEFNLNGDTVGIVRIEGAISGQSSGGLMGQDASSLDQIMKALKAAQERKDIKAVVIRVDSPGGTVAASQEIGEEIDKIRKTGKPVICSMGDVAASGGYWVASSCGTIMANPGTLTGSIGVIMEVDNIEGLLQKLGVRSDVIKSGSFKDIGSMTRTMTADERALLQSMVMDSYDQFLTQVKNGRKGRIDEKLLVSLADGRVFTGRQAKSYGFVDQLGDFPDAIAEAGKQADLSKYSTEELNQTDSFEELMSMFSTQSMFSNSRLLKSVY
ncbi:MAG: signal peptide peptidase SppA [Acidobacteriota bacterium]